jgi:CheY-like chemotaxis protein
MKPPIQALIIDPDLDEARRLAQVLSDAGLAIQIRGEAREALEAFKTYLPEFVLVDERAAQVDGDALSRLLGREDQGRRTPLVLLSGSKKERRKRTKALSSNGYSMHLHKPVSPKELLQALMSLVPQALSLDPHRVEDPKAGDTTPFRNRS